MVQKNKALVVQLNSKEHKDLIITEYKVSPDFKRSVIEEAVVYITRGFAHITRHIWGKVTDRFLARVMRMVPYSLRARKHCDFVPYDEDELKIIAGYDWRDDHLVLVPQTPSSPTLFELVADCLSEGDSEDEDEEGARLTIEGNEDGGAEDVEAEARGPDPRDCDEVAAEVVIPSQVLTNKLDLFRIVVD